MLDFSKNYFELLGLPVRFEVDGAELSSRYRELQQVVHPDRFASSSEQEKRLSMQSAVLINEAYDVLRKPLSRAGYLLKLNGVDLDAGNGGSHDPMFLMEQIELRERLEAVSSEDDPQTALDALMREIGAKLEEQVSDLNDLFSDPDPDKLSQALEIYRKMQFMNKLQQDAESLEEELDELL